MFFLRNELLPDVICLISSLSSSCAPLGHFHFCSHLLKLLLRTLSAFLGLFFLRERERKRDWISQLGQINSFISVSLCAREWTMACNKSLVCFHRMFSDVSGRYSRILGRMSMLLDEVVIWCAEFGLKLWTLPLKTLKKRKKGSQRELKKAEAQKVVQRCTRQLSQLEKVQGNFRQVTHYVNFYMRLPLKLRVAFESSV